MTYIEKLNKATAAGNVCVGLDPVISRMPEHLRERADGLNIFCESIVSSTAPYTAAYKPNLAFFEALGRDGYDALERLIDSVRKNAPQAIIIGDGKRSDIGSTAQRYAVAMFDRWGFDAVTVNPYLGSDGIKPFTERTDRGVYLLAMTTNPSAVELQDHGGEGDPLYLRVARLAETLWNEDNNVGLVVGATRADRIARVRELSPSLPFLIPGVGAQGGDLDTAVSLGLSPDNPPGVINSSRGIIYASSGEDFAEQAGEQAKLLRDNIADCK